MADEKVKQDKLFQFIPDVEGKLRPNTLMLEGQESKPRADGKFVPTPVVIMKANNALQYHVSARKPHYKEVVAHMEAIAESSAKVFGKGKPGSIKEIPLTYKAKDADGKPIVKSNIGSIPTEYVAKPEVVRLKEEIAALKAKGDKAEIVEAKDKELEEKDAHIKELVAQLNAVKSQSLRADKAAEGVKTK